MNASEIIKELIRFRGWSQSILAEKAGFKSQSNITGILNNSKGGIKIDNLVKLAGAMGCEVIIRDTMGSKKEWVIK